MVCLVRSEISSQPFATFHLDVPQHVDLFLSILMALAALHEPILTNHSVSSYFRLSSEGKVIDLIGRVQQYSKAPLA